MAVITVSGPPGCPTEAAARLAAQNLAYEFLSESAIRRLIAEEYGGESCIPERVYGSAVTAVLARLARQHPLLICLTGAEAIASRFLPDVLRVWITAPEPYRTGMLMVDHRMERSAAGSLLAQVESEQRSWRRRVFRRSQPSHDELDLVINAQQLDAEQIAGIVQRTAELQGLGADRLLSAGQEASVQFQARLELARHGIAPAGRVHLERKAFANSSEEVFANLLDFYRIAWEYEPKSFPIEWDNSGRVSESFTPDFYLPEFDLYVELTTMKQSNVTRKNRKLKRIRQIYPHLNIQVFYQRDFQNLIFKFGLADRPVAV